MRPAHIVPRGVRGWLAEASDAIVSLLFPGACRICDKLLTRATRVPICEECLASFEAPREKICELCGQPPAELTVAEGEPLVCRVCRQRTYAFERARSFGKYEGPLVRAILLLKWERIEPLGSWFAQRLTELAGREAGLLAGDVVVPVPLHRDRERERGYNQAGLISKPLARKLDLPHKSVLLMRTRPRPNKLVLSFEERWESVRGAFATRPGTQVDNKRVLLVDDVMTTGATLDACARALLESGAKSVIGLTVARAARNALPTSENGTL
ncbi:MAG TPA: ComF family protein [Candidatus Acidoferrum sp.]|nr:ComF family protein [Candidatus Acidoferrum sp.]